jgi:hypothetical protein
MSRYGNEDVVSILELKRPFEFKIIAVRNVYEFGQRRLPTGEVFTAANTSLYVEVIQFLSTLNDFPPFGIYLSIPFVAFHLSYSCLIRLDCFMVVLHCVNPKQLQPFEEQFGINGFAPKKGFDLLFSPLFSSFSPSSPLNSYLIFFRMCDIPEETRVCITLYARVYGRSDYPLGNVNDRLFNFKGQLLSGLIILSLILNFFDFEFPFYLI